MSKDDFKGPYALRFWALCAAMLGLSIAQVVMAFGGHDDLVLGRWLLIPYAVLWGLAYWVSRLRARWRRQSDAWWDAKLEKRDMW